MADGIIKFKIYPGKLRVYFSLEKYLKDFPDRKGDDYALTNAFATVEHIGPCVVYIREPSPSLVMHEAIHSAWDVLNHVGIRVDHDNHEALTYLAEYIFTETLKLWTRYSH